MLIQLALSFAIGAFVLGACALWKAYVPPQTRAVNELRARVEELERDTESLHERLKKRGKDENMGKARAAHAEKKAENDALRHHAAAILAAQGEAKLTLVPPAAPRDEESERAALRAALIAKGSL